MKLTSEISGCGRKVGKTPLVVTLAGCHQGQKKSGVEHSWMALLSGSDLVQSATFVDFRDSNRFNDLLGGCVRLSRELAMSMELASKRHGRQVPSLAFGGDHTISIGTFLAARARDPTTRLVWIDAHPDINTPDSSTTGNCHGMPVAYLMSLVEWFRMPEPRLKPHEIAYIGLRSIDPAEVERLDYLSDRGGLIYKAEEVRSRGIEPILADIAAKWGGGSGVGAHSGSGEVSASFPFPVHISLDIDSIDPEWAPATGTPVPNGMTPSQVCRTLTFFNKAAAEGVCHLDVVELNPYLSTVEEAAVTVCTSQQVLTTWLRSQQVLIWGASGVHGPSRRVHRMLKRTATAFQLVAPALKEEKSTHSDEEDEHVREAGTEKTADVFARKTSEQVFSAWLRSQQEVLTAKRRLSAPPSSSALQAMLARNGLF